MSNLFAKSYDYYNGDITALSFMYWFCRSSMCVLGNMILKDGGFICLFDYRDACSLRHRYNFINSIDDIFYRLLCGANDDVSNKFRNATSTSIFTTYSSANFDIVSNQPMWWMFTQPEVFAIAEYEVV